MARMKIGANRTGAIPTRTCREECGIGSNDHIAAGRDCGTTADGTAMHRRDGGLGQAVDRLQHIEQGRAGAIEPHPHDANLDPELLRAASRLESPPNRVVRGVAGGAELGGF